MHLLLDVWTVRVPSILLREQLPVTIFGTWLQPPWLSQAKKFRNATLPSLFSFLPERFVLFLCLVFPFLSDYIKPTYKIWKSEYTVS